MNESDDFPLCPANFVCRCAKVSEDTLVGALVSMELATVNDIRREIGAGNGCQACHRVLRRYLQRQKRAYAENGPVLSLQCP